MPLPRPLLACLAAGAIGQSPMLASAAETAVAEPSVVGDPVDRADDAPPSCCTLPSRWGGRVEINTPTNPPEVTLEPSDAGVRVLIDGELFAEYLTDSGFQSAIWPILGPSGMEMTRSWPIGPRKPGEQIDHPHHESFWFAHGGVNGHDFWQKPSAGNKGAPRIVHREFLSQSANSASEVVVVTRNDWTAEGDTILEDERRFAFGLLAPIAGAPRYIDATIRLTASAGPISFADTKEGSFAIRVPGPMKVDAGLGGRILNSNGQHDADTWGRVASWVDYQGPLDLPEAGQAATTGGVAIMSHPASDLPECRWHVREYGLFAANPFGVSDFPDPPAAGREIELAEGDTLTLRYRTVFYGDEVPAEGVRSWYEAFAATPLKPAP